MIKMTIRTTKDKENCKGKHWTKKTRLKQFFCRHKKERRHGICPTCGDILVFCQSCGLFLENETYSEKTGQKKIQTKWNTKLFKKR